MSLRILSYNIERGGVGRDKAIASVIKSCEPDIVILEEASLPDVVQKLASACGMKAWGAIDGESLGFLSRVDIAEHAWHQIWFAKRQYLELVLAGSNARIFGVHLAAVHSNLTERRRAYELSSLLKKHLASAAWLSRRNGRLQYAGSRRAPGRPTIAVASPHSRIHDGAKYPLDNDPADVGCRICGRVSNLPQG